MTNSKTSSLIDIVAPRPKENDPPKGDVKKKPGEFSLGPDFAQKLNVIPCSVAWYSFEDAIGRLQDLHIRATGGISNLKLKEDISADQAKSLYRVAATSMMLEINGFGRSVLASKVESLIQIMKRLRSTAGLDPIVATALLSLPPESHELAKKTLEAWAALSLDKKPGGNHEVSVALRSDASGFLKFNPEKLRELELSKEFRSARNIESLLSSKFEQYGITRGQCIGTARLAGMVGGGIVGAAAGGVAAGPIGVAVGRSVGIQLGSAAGGSMGSALCADVDRKKDAATTTAPAANTSSSGNSSSGKKDPDDDPPKVELAPKGCVVNPDWDFGTKDAYRSFAIRVSDAYFLTRRDLRVFVKTDRKGSTQLHGIDGLREFAKNKTNSDVHDRRMELIRASVVKDISSKNIEIEVEPFERVDPDTAQVVATKTVSGYLYTFSDGSAGNAKFPNGIAVYADGELTQRVLQLLAGPSNVDPVQTDAQVK